MAGIASVSLASLNARSTGWRRKSGRDARDPMAVLTAGHLRLYRDMARTIRKPGVKNVALSEMKDNLQRYLREAETQEIVITRHGRPAGVLIGFHSEEDWFDYRLENDPRFLERIEQARKILHAGRGIRLEDIEQD
jgi:prevent-host-death family protein